VSSRAAVHWDGSSWSEVTLPAKPEVLLRVSGTGPADVWITGGSGAGGQALHWNGVDWTTSALPWRPSLFFALEPGHAIASNGYDQCLRYSLGTWSPDNCGSVPRPFSVWGSGADDIWIVGGVESEAPGGTHRYRAHWDGTAWTREEVDPSFYSATLFGTGKDDVWHGSAHFDGSRWTLVQPLVGYNPQSGVRGGKLWSVSATAEVFSSTDGTLWNRELGLLAGGDVALGATAKPGSWIAAFSGKITTFDGRIWRTLANGAGLALSGAFGSSESDIWGIDKGGETLKLWHWNGASWSSVDAAPSVSPHVDARGWSNGPSDAWLLSTDWPGPQPTTRVFHWDGLTWSLHAEVADASLSSLWGGAPGHLWIGGYRVLGGRRSALVMRWDGKTWSTAYEGPQYGLLEGAGYAWVTGSDRENVWAMTLESAAGTTLDRLLRWNGSAFAEMFVGTAVNTVVVPSGQRDVWLLGGGDALHFDGRSWISSSPLQLTSGPDGLLLTSVPRFGALYVGYEGVVYLNRSSE